MYTVCEGCLFNRRLALHACKKTNVSTTLLVSAPPALPHRPGLSHPLYSYIAGEPHAIALHDYPALQHDELPFQVPVLLPLRDFGEAGGGGVSVTLQI